MTIDINLPPLFPNSEFSLNNLTMIKNSAWSYYNFLIMGGFNIEPNDPFVTSFCDSNSFINLIKNNTCFKGIYSCIDLILTNRKYSFKNTRSLEAGLSDYHHMIYTILKSFFINEKPEVFKLQGL